LVPLRSNQLIEVVRAVMPVLGPEVKIHLLGVMRWELLDEFLALGIASVDTTSPLRQAFLDANNNYYATDPTTKSYTAIRVPQMDGNPKIKAEIAAGKIDLDFVRELERRCLTNVRRWDQDGGSEEDLEVLLDDLGAYGRMLNPKVDGRTKSERMLRDRPWKDCPCAVCRAIGGEVALFRGANRNRRRGFHNLYVTYERLQAALARHEAQSTDRAINVG